MKCNRPRIKRVIKPVIKPTIKPVIQIGKAGVTGAIIAEIKTRLKKQEIIKVKILKSARNNTDRYTIAEGVAEKSNANLIDIRGNTFTLKR